METILIIIAMTYSFRPYAVHTEHIQFNSMNACLVAKQTIDKSNKFGDGSGRPVTFCVEKGE